MERGRRREEGKWMGRRGIGRRENRKGEKMVEERGNKDSINSDIDFILLDLPR